MEGFFYNHFMQEFVVYILYSHQHHKTYVGFTSNLIARFHSHNSLGTKGYTLKYRPWVVVHVEFFSSKSLALSREKFLKTGKGRQFIQQILSV